AAEGTGRGAGSGPVLADPPLDPGQCHRDRRRHARLPRAHAGETEGATRDAARLRLVYAPVQTDVGPQASRTRPLHSSRHARSTLIDRLRSGAAARSVFSRARLPTPPSDRQGVRAVSAVKTVGIKRSVERSALDPHL